MPGGEVLVPLSAREGVPARIRSFVSCGSLSVHGWLPVSPSVPVCVSPLRSSFLTNNEGPGACCCIRIWGGGMLVSLITP